MTDHPSALVRRAVLDWIRDDLGFAAKATITPAQVDAIVGKLRAATPAAPQAAGVGEVAERVTAALERDQFCAGTTLRHQDVRCLLSALRAPSREPEGGAVSPQVYRLLQLADAALANVTAFESDARYIMGNTNYAITDNARSEIRQFLLALATREEAPAEAGDVRDRLIEILKRVDDGVYASLNDQADAIISAFILRPKDPSEGGAAVASAARALLDACYKADENSDLSDFVDGMLLTRLDKALRAHPQAREDAQPVAWLRAVDEEMVCAHLGVADAEDSYETAKKKLASLIQWNIAVAMDPSVGGYPAPDALRVAREAVLSIKDAADSFRDCSGDEVAGQVIIRCDQALAALQAEQKGGA